MTSHAPHVMMGHPLPPGHTSTLRLIPPPLSLMAGWQARMRYSITLVLGILAFYLLSCICSGKMDMAQYGQLAPRPEDVPKGGWVGPNDAYVEMTRYTFMYVEVPW